MLRLTGYLAIAATMLLSACGGGGNDGTREPVPPVASSAQGFWTGQTSTGIDVSLVVLNGGDTWGVYHRDGVLQGALRGVTTSANGSLSGTSDEIDLVTGAVTTGAFSGTYGSDNGIQVQTNSVAFTGNYSSAYDQRADESALVGTYSGSGAHNSSATPTAFEVSSGGNVNVRVGSTLRCNGDGRLYPRASGKNVFQFEITFGGLNCPSGYVSGIVYYDNGALIAMALPQGSQINGFVFIGRKNEDDMPPTPTSPTSSAEGIWAGRTSTGFDVSMAVLEDGDVWGVYHRNGVLYDVLLGTTTSTNGMVSGTGANTNFRLTPGAYTTSTFNGTYTPKSNFQIQTNGASVSGNYSNTYDQPANLSTLEGTYSGSGIFIPLWTEIGPATYKLPSSSTSLSITASGVIKLNHQTSPALNCAGSGVLRPRANNKNVFDFQYSYDGMRCGSIRISGVAYQENGALIVLGVREGSTVVSFAFVGRK